MLLNEDNLQILEAVDAPATVLRFGIVDPDCSIRAIPSEVPVNFVYGGIPFAVMIATPSDLDDFAVGFSLTEGVIQAPGDIRGTRIVPDERGLRVAIDLTPNGLHEHLAHRRVLSWRTGCGLCGIDDLDALPQARFRNGPAPRVSPGAIRATLRALDREQLLNERTRTVYGAAWADTNGTLVCVREHVGRHNALDNLIGTLCRRGTKHDSGFVIATSRSSFELVEKVAVFGARTLVAISAPTLLALERARHLDMSLVAIARHNSVTVFHGRERILGEDGWAWTSRSSSEWRIR
ncbi:formate dehydrogenase accessory sulfurtransferase FdhD [Microvirga lotononidis]|nr:formate dehydrogenase accessory sulfurtransferase FdhD [Microvirga lotononidis]WQO29955.1 formate dehydrogenase accessory sulfurtransferase FdhD [Microvirga lotononidis]WQO30578.1 formate dehydrogenase accessory sulfurtransferase FdhD [Microvirga lotononidis]